MPFQGENRPSEQKGFRGEQRPEQRGWGADAALQFVAGIPRGLVGAASSMMDVLPSDQTPAWTLKTLGDVSGLIGDQTNAAKFHTAGERLNAARGIHPLDAQGNVNRIEGAVTGLSPEAMRPQTTAGEVANTAGNFVGASAIGGPGRGIVTRGIQALVPALASETAGQAARKFAPKYESAARTGAALATGLATGAFTGGPKAAPKIYGNAAPPIPAPQQAQVVDLMRNAENIGHPLMFPEAVDYIVPGAKMGNIARVAEGTKAGIERMGPLYAARPKQTGAVVGSILDELALASDPRTVALAAQQAAEGAIAKARKGVNEAAGPSYDALKGQALPDADFAALKANPSYAKALAAFRNDPELNGPYAHLPDNNLAVVNEVTKKLDAMATSAAPAPGNVEGSQQLAGLRGQARTSAADLAAAISNDWEKAHGTVATGHATVIDPMAMGPMGDIATVNNGLPANNASQMGAAILPKNPLEGSLPGNIEAAQTVGPGVIRSTLADALSNSQRDIFGLPNTRAGASFAGAVAGDPLQAQNLSGVVNAVSPSAGLRLGNALEIFKASGTRRGEGSPTQSNLDMKADIDAGAAAARAVGGGGSLRMIYDRLAGWANQIGIEVNQKQIAAAAVSNPDEAARLLKAMEDARGDSLQSRAAANALRSFIGAQGHQQEQP